MGLLKKLAGGVMKGVGDALVTNGKSLREEKRLRLREDAATNRTQMSINSREKTSGAALTEQTRTNKAREQLTQSGQVAAQDARDQVFKGKQAERAATAAERKAKRADATEGRWVDTALKIAKVTDPSTGEKTFDPKLFNTTLEAFRNGTPLSVTPKPFDPTVTYASGDVVVLPDGSKAEYDGKGFKKLK